MVENRLGDRTNYLHNIDLALKNHYLFYYLLEYVFSVDKYLIDIAEFP